MNIIVARHAGFCFGVERAVSLALSHANEKTPIYTLGELIHNPTVIKTLQEQNVIPISTEDALIKLKGGSKLVIRSHGVSPEIIAACRANGIVLLDATCPFVRRIHSIVQAAAENKMQVLVAGQPRHPEVEGIRGWAGGNAVILANQQEAEALLYDELPAALVAQTTMQYAEYQAIHTIVKQRRPNLTVHETICDTTVQRQQEAAELAQKCDMMLVIGGRNSSNTQKLAAICTQYCKHTYSIESPGELLLEIIHSDDIIGIVAGASTPQWMIREVVTVMNELEKATAESAQVEANPAQEDANQTEATITMEGEAAEAQAASVEAEPAAQVDTPQAEAAQAPEADVDEPIAGKPAEASEEKAASPAKTAAKKPSQEVSDTDSFAEAFEKTMVRIRNGQVLTGTVVQVADGEVCVNIGYKSDGFIPRNEFSSDPDANPDEIVKVGDSIDVEVLKVNDGEGNVLLSRKSVEGKKLWEDLMAEAENPETIFEGVGKEVVKGGLIATIHGVRAFVPASHVGVKYVESLTEYVGKPMKLSVIEVDKSRKRIVASQKNVLMRDLEAAKKERWSTLEVGSKLKGIVRRLTDFGAFVDIGGIDGLVHVTDVAWGRVKHPSDILKIGQEIEVLILNVDVDKERISLGYKQLQPKPWTMAGEKYPVGSIVEGKVVRIVPFGAFVALEPTIDGLIHISQVSLRRIAKVEDEINVGDIVRCKVLDVNPEAKRISLSRRDVILEENPELAEQIAAERAERDRAFAERQEQRLVERQQRVAKPERAPQAPSEKPANTSRPEQRPERQERQERRPRRSEDGDYDLPPVQSTTTSLADLFQGLNLSDEPAAEAPAKAVEPTLEEAKAATEEE